MKKIIYSIRFRVLLIILIAVILQYWFIMSQAVKSWERVALDFSKKGEALLLKELKKEESYFLRTIFRGTFLYKPQGDLEGINEYLRNLRGMEEVESIRIFKDSALQKYRIAFDGDASRLNRVTAPLDCLACHPGVTDIGEKRVRLHDTSFYNEAKSSINLAGDKSFLFFTHVYSEGSCVSCHGPDKKVLGVLQANFSSKGFDKLSKDFKENFKAESQNFKNVFIFLAVASFIISILLTFVFIDMIFISKLRKVKNILEKISFGETDLDLSVLPSSQDEFGSLKNSIELMIRAINFLK